MDAVAIETVAAVVVVLDAQGRIVEFNRAAEALTGYASEEICVAAAVARCGRRG